MSATRRYKASDATMSRRKKNSRMCDVAIGLALLALVVAGCSRPNACTDAVLAQPPNVERFAYIASDFSSSSIGLLDADGVPTGAALINSGSIAPGTLTALSGDVVFATEQPNDRLLFVERLGADLVTDINRRAWYVEQQSRVSPLGMEGSTFSANPQDVLAMSDDVFWVTRHNPNLETGVAPNSAGNDIAIIARPDGQLLQTVPLTSANATVDDDIAYARPVRMVFVAGGEDTADSVVVGLARLSEDFMVVGPGAVAIVDVEAAAVTAVISLPPLSNCGEVRPVPGQPGQVAVVCTGTTFMGPEARRSSSGVAIIDVHARQILNLWRASDYPMFLPPQYGLIPLGGTRVVVVGLDEGEAATTINNELLLIDLATNFTQVIATSSGEGLGFGAGAFDPATSVLLVPDANQSSFRRFDQLSELQFAERPVANASLCSDLPVREIALLSRPNDG